LGSVECFKNLGNVCSLNASAKGCKLFVFICALWKPRNSTSEVWGNWFVKTFTFCDESQWKEKVHSQP
jgi:hypothetical protein